jgi:hypothetical protein
MDDDTRLMNIGLFKIEAMPTSTVLRNNGFKVRYYLGKDDPLQG